MIDKDKLHAFLFATLFPNETSDDRRYGEGFRRLARDKAFEKATDLTSYYVERYEMEKVLPKGVDLPHFKYELRKFFDDVIQSSYEHEKPYSYGVRIVDINSLQIPREGKIITLWGHLHFKPASESLNESLKEFYNAFFTKENIRALYDALHGLKYIKL